MRPYTPKVGQHVNYLRSDGRLRSATVTGVISPTVLNLRVGHGGEVYTGVSKQSADNQSGVWSLANAYDCAPVADPSILLQENGDAILDESGANNVALES